MVKQNGQRGLHESKPLSRGDATATRRNHPAGLVLGNDDDVSSSSRDYSALVPMRTAATEFEVADSARHGDSLEQAARPQSLSPSDQAVVVEIAKMLRAAVLRSAGDDADRIAERVVEKLRHSPPVAEPEHVFIDAAEAAAILGITRDAFDKRVQRRQIPGVVRTAGRRIQIDKARMLAGLAKRGR